MSDQSTAAPPPEAPPAKSAGAERFETGVTILIALVSTIIALAAAQSAVFNGDAVDAQHNGVLAKINLERANGDAYVWLAQNQRVFAQYQTNQTLYDLTNAAAETAVADERAAHGTRLYLEAAAYYEDVEVARDFLDPAYLITDAEDDYVGIDAGNFLQDRQQSAAVYQDIDFTDDFAEADQARYDSNAMALSLVALFVAVLFLTWAQITSSALKWVWLLIGSLITLMTLGIYALSTLLKTLGG